MPLTELELYLQGEGSQLKLAAVIASSLQPGSVIFLEGDLGTGKTTLVRGILQGLGYEGNVKSPTYTLVEPYQVSSYDLYHFDLYRLGEPDELEYAGGRDYFDGQAINLIEWPEKAEGYLPEPDLLFELHYESRNGNDGRRCKLKAFSEKGAPVIQAVSQVLSDYLD